jgi:hypothetical protein
MPATNEERAPGPVARRRLLSHGVSATASHGCESGAHYPPSEYGERQYQAEDLAGHRWTFSETLRDVAPEEWGGTTKAAWRVT